MPNFPRECAEEKHTKEGLFCVSCPVAYLAPVTQPGVANRSELAVGEVPSA